MARYRFAGLLVACGIVLTGASAWAQEPRQDKRFGLTANYPGSGGIIGLIWQTSGRTAFRPEISFTSRFAGENTSGSSTQAGVAVTILRYFARKDAVAAYIGPRLSYSRASSNMGTGSSSSVASAYGAGGLLGLQYDVTRRIAVYGEVGAAYGYTKNTYSGGTVQTASTHTIGSRGAIGLNLYF